MHERGVCCRVVSVCHNPVLYMKTASLIVNMLPSPDSCNMLGFATDRLYAHVEV